MLLQPPYAPYATRRQLLRARAALIRLLHERPDLLHVDRAQAWLYRMNHQLVQSRRWWHVFTDWIVFGPQGAAAPLKSDTVETAIRGPLDPT